jgi:hypothetical protein
MVDTPISIEKQRNLFLRIIQKNSAIRTVLTGGFVNNIQNWYLVAGCLNQTVWNYLTGRNVQNGIKDYDLIYFDPDISKQKELKIKEAVIKKYRNLNVSFDVVNQARVHTWMEKDMGIKIRPLLSTEDAISTWPITVSCLGVRKENGRFVVVAPYGLSDTLNMTLRPNKTTVMRKSDFYYKVNNWVKRWAELTVIPWDSK